MKQCLTCSHLADGEANTCLHCGEASWGPSQNEESAVDPEDTEPSTPKAKGRGKK